MSTVDFPILSMLIVVPAVGAVLVLGVAPATLLYAVVLLVTSIEVGTRGFVAFDRAGVTLDDRSYARGDREVRLVGMMHVGEEDSYREVVASFSIPATVVLEEGVTDRSGLLESPLAYDGVAGFHSAFANSASAILLDYHLPNAQGDYVLGRLKDTDITRQIPVIVVTGMKDRAIERKMMNLGAEVVFTKPLDFATLRRELARHINILAGAAPGFEVPACETIV